MSEPSGEESIVLPPLPLATGLLLPGGGAADASRRIAEVALVVRTEDGVEHRVPLVEQHGAWWAPSPPRWTPESARSTDRATSRNHPHPEG
ncbi:hypothetical protein [Blastococcus sp. TF02A-26]|uniref:hypothetical protein n=1 Tax=Blastococcus sp. TF02A-26 TaxID=2250577 RepID=UPI0018F44AB4|nr:hypothetical protein [Blastococcus sp. TF02A-26]